MRIVWLLGDWAGAGVRRVTTRATLQHLLRMPLHGMSRNVVSLNRRWVGVQSCDTGVVLFWNVVGSMLKTRLSLHDVMMLIWNGTIGLGTS